MKEYLENYKQLLKLLETNKNKIQENQTLLDENYQKWNDIKEKQEKLDLELSELNNKYHTLMNEKEEKKLKKIENKLALISLLILLIIGLSNHIVITLLIAAILTFINGSIYMMILIINKCTSIFEKEFKKDKEIAELIETITKKENELSIVKTECEKYSQEIIKYQSKSKKLNEKRLWINNSIDELMRKYATPIFNEQLKNIDEEAFENTKTKTKKKNKKQ